MTFSLRPYFYIQTLFWLFFFVSIAYFNRFAADDFYFLSEIKTKNSFDIFHNLQFGWHGRFSSNFLLAYLIPLNHYSYFLLSYNLVSFGLLLLAIFRLLKNAVHYFSVETKNLFFYALILMSILFFCTLSPNDSWFWFTGSVVYFYSTIALLLLLSVFFKKEKNSWDYLLLIVSSILIGGSNETMTIIVVLFLIGIVLKEKPTFRASLPFIIAITLLSIGFLIIYFSEGTKLRDNITPDLSWQNIILYTGYATVKTLFFQFHKTFLPALFLGIPFLFSTIIKTNKNNFQPIKELLYACIIIGIVVFINHLIAVIPLGALSPERITTVSSVLIVILLIRYLVLLGSKIHISERLKKVILATNTIGVMVFVVATFQIHKNYATAYDNRMEKLEKIKTTIKHQNPVYLQPLPASGYLPSAEITTDSTHFLNVDLKRYFELNNVLILEK
ncbi:MAG: hypothetical protein COW67_05690 [Flavobacteriales bacterium CG18_big_fil_WC_8_21_14_2_50_32_9]|nr:MAG: hypothetical protein COW67_05690 [Flavobacteriales bacterium CG18_big_fil_WC_8_21_14_2_50_32_9]